MTIERFMDYSDIINIVVAGGSGSRFGGPLPKQFLPLDGTPVLMHAITRIREALPGSFNVVVLGNGYEAVWQELCNRHKFTSPMIVTGGDTRWQSVKNAIDATARHHARIITVHDGARPLVTRSIINRVIAACDAHHGAIPAVSVTDSLRQITGPDSSVAVDRSMFRAVQTPQAFRADELRRAYTMPYSPLFTDDASVMAAAGHTDITLVDGDSSNIKITLPADIKIAEIYMRHCQG